MVCLFYYRLGRLFIVRVWHYYPKDDIKQYAREAPAEECQQAVTRSHQRGVDLEEVSNPCAYACDHLVAGLCQFLVHHNHIISGALLQARIGFRMQRNEETVRLPNYWDRRAVYVMSGKVSVTNGPCL